MKMLTALAFIAFAGQAAAYEVAPLTREQVACYGKEYAILAHVVNARSYVCQRRAPGCFPSYVEATTVVDEVISPSHDGLHVGDTIRVSFSVSQPASFVRPEDLRYDGSIIFPDNHADEITDEFARSQLVGRSLFFSIASIRRSLIQGIPSRVDAPFYAEAYPTEDAEWFRRTWAATECRNEQAKADVARRKLGLTGRQ
jgi:hypothetical protein